MLTITNEVFGVILTVFLYDSQVWTDWLASSHWQLRTGQLSWYMVLFDEELGGLVGSKWLHGRTYVTPSDEAVHQGVKKALENIASYSLFFTCCHQAK